MRKVCLIFLGLVLCIDSVNAAVRSQNTQSVNQTTTTSRQATNRNIRQNETSARTVSSRNASTKPRTVSTKSRSAGTKSITGRSAVKNIVRSLNQPTRISRAAATSNVRTRTFDENYTSCRDAYFTCMDQFCATQNESYRRCVCSSKLKDIQNQEKKLSQTADSLKDFEDLNIDMISKTSNEVKAMISASEGEAAIKKDNSASSNTLKNVSNVLSDTKKQSMANQGKLDIGGDIKSLWNSTNLIGGTEIANLTGEALFNAVHSQCAELVAETCAGSDLKMVASSYGMYIENDCAVLENNLKNKTTAANSAIRTTRHKMQDARLENYDAHNSLSINDCISKVRQDIIADTACGKGYIHCLDFSGKYINITTGEAIYTPEFYQLVNQISLSGDVLNNKQNASFVAMLNQKRPFAEKNLGLCQDDADEVWNEFLRQALVEIYQSQQARIKTVKEECLQVVNDCYDKQSKQLKNFTDNSSKINTSQTLILSEEMCAEKLDTCSNLYGGGEQGLATLVATMATITDTTIEQSCAAMLDAFAKNTCSVPNNDTKHKYPYACRKYTPGESRFARVPECNTTLVNPFSRSDVLNTKTINTDQDYTAMCLYNGYKKVYTSCNFNFFLATSNKTDISSDVPYGDMYYTEQNAESCALCPTGFFCSGGTKEPINLNQSLYDQCGTDYIGSLYQQFVIYALQNCTRDSDVSGILSESLIADIDNIMKKVRKELVQELVEECEEYGGQWIEAPWQDNNADGWHDIRYEDALLNNFYFVTGANKLWGYCKRP